MKGLLKVDLRMLRSFLISVPIFVFLSHACKSNSALMDSYSDKNAIELIVQENYSGFDDEQFLMIHNQEDLRSFYGRVNRTRKPGLTPPLIDFNKEMVLVWCVGEVDSGNTELEFSSLQNNILVQKIKFKPKKDQENLKVQPFYIYKLPKTSKTLLFD
ncbi:hypothetical protein ACNR9Q_09950 [Maribacter sp. X9]|uniref:hypothetical protein n=1 Tax=Maribacter sp. X9 TaxID=3402159 RepID=UPI003AF36A52